MHRAFIINLGSVDHVPVGKGRSYQIKDMRVAVFRPREDEVAALEDECPHCRCGLADGNLEAEVVVCPEEGHRYDLSSGEEEGDPDRGVRVFFSWIEHGNIYLQYSPYIVIDGIVTALQ
ncbi:MAG: Rieske 2Fe-2S domain-containing protein [Candidatus Omnitrophica bacterium]|nr:Rieske 2Fe-2S domain-containing protein [Candidatus Omnitrophota bacterium]